MNRLATFERATLDPFYHELRTSLTLIQTCTDLLMNADETSQEELRQFLQIIRRGGTRIDRLVRDYILLAKHEMGMLAQEHPSAPTSLLPSINLALLEARPEAGDRAIDVIADLPETLPLVKANADDLRVISARLINIAFRFAQKDGDAVVVQTRTEPDSVALVVTAEGTPILAEDMAYIFDWFFVPRNLPLSREQHGLGLDFPVVKALTEIHQGGITVQRVAHGNIFTCKFPRAEPDEA